MIPLMTLSIPEAQRSPSSWAVFSSGPGAHGPPVFTTRGVDTSLYPDQGFALSNIAMVFVGRHRARYVVNVVKIQIHFCDACVWFLALVGSYAINASMFDVFVAIAFGALGYLMNKLTSRPQPSFWASSWAALRRRLTGECSMVMAVMGYFFRRPVCLVLMALIVLSIASDFHV